MSKIKPMAVVVALLACAAAEAESPYSLSAAWSAAVTDEADGPPTSPHHRLLRKLDGEGFGLRRSASPLRLGGLTTSAAGYTPAAEHFRSVYSNPAAGLLVGVGSQTSAMTMANRWALAPSPDRRALQTDVYKTYGAATAFASVGRMSMADTAGSTDFRDPWFSSLGVSYRLTPRTSAGLTYDYRQKLWSDGEGVREGSAFISYRLAPALRLQGYAVTGFSPASPNWGIGANVSVGF